MQVAAHLAPANDHLETYRNIGILIVLCLSTRDGHSDTSWDFKAWLLVVQSWEEDKNAAMRRHKDERHARCVYTIVLVQPPGLTMHLRD